MDGAPLGRRPGVTTEQLVASGWSPTLTLGFCISKTMHPICPTGLLGTRAKEPVLAERLRTHRV